MSTVTATCRAALCALLSISSLVPASIPRFATEIVDRNQHERDGARKAGKKVDSSKLINLASIMVGNPSEYARVASSIFPWPSC